MNQTQVTSRRRFGLAVAASAATATAAPALAQANPKIRWRIPSSFGKNIDIANGGVHTFINAVREMTGGNFELQWFGPGELVSPLGVIDAVSGGVVEAGYSAMFYNVGKDPAFQFGSGLPFGMNVRGHAAWWHRGGGEQLVNQFLSQHKLMALMSGDTGAQMGGWFRKEIRSLADFRGVKMRIAGVAGQVFARAGGAPQQLPIGEVYAALERGTIDATKFTSPADDERLGFVKVAPFYYYPGWNDPGVASQIFFNLEKWNELPKQYKEVCRAAAAQSYQYMVSRYDAENPAAVRRIIASGAKLRLFPDDVIRALADAADAYYNEIAAGNEAFRGMYRSYRAFRDDFYVWWQVADASFDAMQLRLRRKS
jgi:TRAP-type mannitol/chloroaromatic compound transport system substrate-binding protein